LDAERKQFTINDADSVDFDPPMERQVVPDSAVGLSISPSLSTRASGRKNLNRK
jgi:hypothetical protein